MTEQHTDPPSNMALWDSVCQTDPAQTKLVKQRGGYTSIDGQYMMHKATEAFGPCGLGWGFADPVWEYRDAGKAQIVICHLRLWWLGEDGKRQVVPETSCKELVTAGGHVDCDAFKKATTDAMKKALSRVGFCADVFLGKFDDEEYVEEQREAHRPPEEIERDELRAEWGRVHKVSGIDPAGVLKLMGHHDPKAAPNDAVRDALEVVKTEHAEKMTT